MTQDETELHKIRVALIRKYFDALDEDARAQAKYEHLCAIMEGESGNFSAGIWVTLLADFAIGCFNNGFDPKVVLLNLRRDANKLVEQKLKEQGVTAGKPMGTA